MDKQALRTVILIAFVSAIVFIPFLGGIPLFDWDEVNFAEVAREMIVTGDYSRAYIDFAPFWEKPPLFFWFQAMSMNLFGIGDFAARFPNALCGVITLCILYLIGRRLYDHRFGILWVLAYGGSLLPHLYFRSGIIDPWFNLFIFLTIYSLFRAGTSAKDDRIAGNSETAQAQHSDIHSFTPSLIVLGGIFLGLAVLTKGPVAYLIIVLIAIAHWIIKRYRGGLSFKTFILCSLVGAVVFGAWYAIETMRNGTWFITEFTKYQWELLIRPGAEHAGFPGYHVVVLLFGCFPASIFAFQPLFRRNEENAEQGVMKRWMILLLIVVVVVFSLVQSKIVHYSSLCYFPITFLATIYIWRIYQNKNTIGSWQRAGVIGICLLFTLAGIALVWFGNNPKAISGLVSRDVNATASLSMQVNWHWWHILPVCFLIAAIVVMMVPFRDAMKKAMFLYLLTGAFAYSGIALWVGKVQQYTQGPATEFFSSLAGKDVYAVTWGHKSYSPYWDFRKPMPESFMSNNGVDQRYSDTDFLLTSPDIGKDVYVITKAGKAEEFQERYPEAEKIGEKGGFVFFRKMRK